MRNESPSTTNCRQTRANHAHHKAALREDGKGDERVVCSPFSAHKQDEKHHESCKQAELGGASPAKA
jgi:hypothetical protein